MTIPGTDGRKMSKSYDNIVPILADPAEVRRRVMAIVTDSRRPEEPKDPETCRVFALYRHVAPPEAVEAVSARYRAGGIGYAEVKSELLQRLDERFREARARYDELMTTPEAIDDVLASGAARARQRATPVLEAARAAVGLPPRPSA